MGQFDFKIQDESFTLPDKYSELSDFKVDSVPRPYKVAWWDEDPAQIINREMADAAGNVLVIDEKLRQLFSAAFGFSPERIFSLVADEEHKILDTAAALFDFLQARGFSKSDRLIVVGGGVTQDVGGFVGGIYKRGLNWVFYPTTLLSMCDSCIGAKAGLNFKGVKNQLAIFSAPREVVVNPQFLKTLNEREFHSGLGEILKLHVTGGGGLLENYQKIVADGIVKDFTGYKSLIFGSLFVKKAVIEKDEFEQGLRKSLNYGHTFGHAIETLTGYNIPHGQAVAAGMIIVNQLAHERGLLRADKNLLMQNLCLKLLDAPTRRKIKCLSGDNFLELLRQDKKASSGRINLVFLKDLGETIFVNYEINKDLSKSVDKVITSIF
ncbi:MAG: 3-dehydroquinate synthase [Candidatus Doudnabacteria bacterium]|nr:3-dehydroquinate synthase [Candidatus Doudnabacteria bacterium]